MSQILLFVLLGLGSGALIAALAQSLVLSYRGSGVINLSTGVNAMVGAYCFWALTAGKFGFTVGNAPALAITFGFVIVYGIVVDLVAFRPLRSATPLARLAASLGVFLSMQSIVTLAFSPNAQLEPNVLPTSLVHVLGQNIPVNRFIVTGIAVVIAGVLAVAYRYSRFGLATRAAAENQTHAVMMGLSPNRISLINSVLGSVIAGMVGVLAAPMMSLDPMSLPLEVVPALAAALFADFTSFGVAWLAGMLMGVLVSLCTYLTTQTWMPTFQGQQMPGISDLVIFVMMLIALAWRGRKLVRSRGDVSDARLPVAPRATNVIRNTTGGSIIGIVALIVLPFAFRQGLVTSMIGVILALSVVVTTGYVGQISIVQVALAGAAAFMLSHLAAGAGIPFPWAPIICVFGATLLGLVIAIPALRVRGVTLAVVTLAGAVAIQNFGFGNPTWGAGLNGSSVPEPRFWSFDVGPSAAFRGLDGSIPSPIFGFLVLLLTVAACMLVANLRSSNLGQRMLAVRSNERAAAAAGIEVRSVKIIAFGISAMLAGIAGTLYSYNYGSVTADSFNAMTALALIANTYVGGVTMVSGAVFAGSIVSAGLMPTALQQWFGLSGTWALLFGGVMLLVTLAKNPEGLAGAKLKRQLVKKQRAAELARGELHAAGPADADLVGAAN